MNFLSGFAKSAFNVPRSKVPDNYPPNHQLKYVTHSYIDILWIGLEDRHQHRTNCDHSEAIQRGEHAKRIGRRRTSRCGINHLDIEIQSAI